MEIIDLAAELLDQDDVRKKQDMEGELPGWAVHKILRYQHQQELLGTPDRFYLCKKTGQRFKCTDPQFEMNWRPNGYTGQWEYFWHPNKFEVFHLSPLPYEAKTDFNEVIKPFIEKIMPSTVRPAQLLMIANQALFAPAMKISHIKGEPDQPMEESDLERVRYATAACILALEKIDETMKPFLP